jgi:drug/metabolite transporter (DMT)-like permease
MANEAVEQKYGNQNFSFLTGTFTAFLCIIFGTNSVAIKMTFNGLGVFTTAGIRFIIAAAVIYLWAKATKQNLRLQEGQLRLILIFTLMFIVQLSLLYFGLNKSSASHASLIANLVPFLILILAHLFIPGDRITGRKLIGMLLGFGGVLFIFLEEKGVSADFRTGDLLMLLATFIWACNTVYLKRIISAFTPFHITFYSMLVAIPFFFLEALLWDDRMIINIDAGVLAGLFYQSIITAAFAFVVWNYLLQKHGAVALHSFTFIVPIAGVLASGLILGEPITPRIVLSLVLIVAGILAVHFKSPKPAPAYPIRRDV